MRICRSILLLSATNRCLQLAMALADATGNPDLCTDLWCLWSSLTLELSADCLLCYWCLFTIVFLYPERTAPALVLTVIAFYALNPLNHLNPFRLAGSSWVFCSEESKPGLVDELFIFTSTFEIYRFQEARFFLLSSSKHMHPTILVVFESSLYIFHLCLSRECYIVSIYILVVSFQLRVLQFQFPIFCIELCSLIIIVFMRF